MKMNTKQQQRIILVTPTFKRPERSVYLDRCIKVFKEAGNILWLVVEDAEETDNEVEEILRHSGLEYVYFNYGRTQDRGNSQKDLAFRYIKDNKLEGIVYSADDDNAYDIRLFDEIRRTRKVGILPVGNLGPNGIERPLIENHRIVGWDARWLTRKYCVDWAAIVFDADLLQGLDEPLLKGFNRYEAIKSGLVDEQDADNIWLYQRMESETDFIEKLVLTQDELELLCDECKKCLVWHNQPLGKSMAVSLLKYRIKKSIFSKPARLTLRTMRAFGNILKHPNNNV